MKSIQTLFFFFFGISMILSQVVTTDPVIPIDSKAVRIIFNAAVCSGNLKGFTGDVYAHTGVITNKSISSSDWKYVKTNWGQNTPETKLTRIGTDLYELYITPTIRQYYGVPSSESILQMAFVFRSADTSKEGKGDGGTDIFVDVHSEGFIVQIDQPADNSILDPGKTVNIKVYATEVADLELSINDAVIMQSNGNVLEFEYQFMEPGNYWLVAIGNNGSENTEDTLFVCVLENQINEAMPEQYKKGVNDINETSIALVLWAPFKENVFVIGEFNDWRPLNEFQMKKDGDYFWLEIDGLWSDYPYIYQYLIDGELLIADPYTDQVSDPFNDKHIPSIVYPDLVAYPLQKTSGLASVLYAGQQEFTWETDDFTPVEKEKLIIYELLIRDFQEDHTYASVIEKLDYLQTLGITALELMPVNEFEGNSSWGYNPSFYFAPDKYYGPKNELKRLIDECHKRGISVIIDMVLNHSYGQSPFAQMYLENGKPAPNNPWYNVDHNFTNPDAHWGYDFNHESPATQELVDSINAYWMSEYRVDGFRFDFTKGFGNNIKNSSDSWGSKYDADRIRLLKRMSDEIWERNPDAFVCFEHLSDNTEEKELANYGILLWGNMNHNYGEAAMGYHTSNKSNLSWGLYQARGWNDPNLITYMESHDEERVMFKISQFGNSSGNYSTKDKIIASHRIGLNSLFFLPLPGPKMLWQFCELGYDISIDQDCRVCEKPILWEYYEEWQRKNIYDIMTNLNHLKSNYSIFSAAEISYGLTGEVKQYQLENEGDFVKVVGNFSVNERTTNVVFPQIGSWYEFFTDEIIQVNNINTQITLKPGEYKLYSTSEFEWKTSMSPVNTNDTMNNTIFKALELYPNPATDHIEWDIPLKWFQVYDETGRLIEEIILESDASKYLDISHLDSGFYTLLGQDENGIFRNTQWIKR